MEAATRKPLQPSEVFERLRAQFGDDVTGTEEQFGHAVATVKPDRYQEIASFLRDEPDIACDFFDFTAGVDRKDEGMEVVTHLASSRHGHGVRLKVLCDKDDPRCPTLSGVYAGAAWHERETWELFGIVFDGHPHLVKLLLPEPFEGHPLRKDFALMTREAKPWPGAVEGEEEEEE